MTLSQLVTDGKDTWLLSRTFLFYTAREARRLFRRYVKEQGWKFA